MFEYIFSSLQPKKVETFNLLFCLCDISANMPSIKRISFTIIVKPQSHIK